MNIDELAQKHAGDFPGYKLVDFYEAAFPSYAIQLQVLMELKRPIPVLEEFILKAVDAGMTKVPDIAGVLGLEHNTAEAGLDQLQRRNYIYFKVSKETGKSIPVLITEKGRAALREMYITEPEPGSYPLCMDALTGLLYRWEPLSQSSDIKNLDIHQIPTFIPAPRLEQIDFLSLKRLVADTQRDLPTKTERRELVDVLGIEKQWTAYKRMRILQYLRESDGAVLVQVFDKADRSIEHEAALINMENQKFRPLRAVIHAQVPNSAPEEFSVIDTNELEAARKVSLEGIKIKDEIDARKKILDQAQALQSSELVQDRREATFQTYQLKEQISALEDRLKEMETQAGTTEVLQMYEHRPKLISALRTAIKQIIIVSPWLNTDAVDYELRQEIANSLKRGINIYIAYGFGEPSSAEIRTVNKLKEIAQKKKGKLSLFRVGDQVDIHSKVLICDQDFMIMSSFNWLSFAGDPTRGSRIEDGMLTRDKKAIAIKTQEWVARMTNVSPSKELEKTIIQETYAEKMIRAGESNSVEFKSTLRWNIKANMQDSAMEHEVLKSIVAFLNTDGGCLLVGVDDDGKVLGTEIDGFLSDDKYLLHFTNLVNAKIGKDFSDLVKYELQLADGKKILIVNCARSPRAVFLKHDKQEEFFIRTGPASVQLSAREVLDYSRTRFPQAAT